MTHFYIASQRKPSILLMISKWETGSCLDKDKSRHWPFDAETFIVLHNGSCSRPHGGMLLGQVVRVA